MILTDDAAVRKELPMCTGLIDYFPRALAAVSRCSLMGNRQHHPEKPLHWDKNKSRDHADCIVRHLVDRGCNDSDGTPHIVKLAWRALALLETTIQEGEIDW